jgi:hypothetical protein
VSTKLKRTILAGVLAIAAAAVLATGLYITWIRTPPPMPQSIEDAIALMDSPRYQRLNEQQRRPYTDQMFKLGQSLTPEQRAALRDRMKDNPAFTRNRREMGAEWMLNQARDFAKADDFKRRQVLNQIIAMQEAAAGRGERRGPPREGQARAEHDAWMQEKIEHGDPQRQAYMSEFWKALRQRRREMGLPPDPVPHQR